MAVGDTKLTICNDALLMLGAAEMTSFTEGTDSAKICDRLYDDLKSISYQFILGRLLKRKYN